MFDGNRLARVTREEEFEYFDELGPLTREALQDTFFRWCVMDILREIRRRGMFPKKITHDEQMAREIRKNDSFQKLMYLDGHGSPRY